MEIKEFAITMIVSKSKEFHQKYLEVKPVELSDRGKMIEESLREIGSNCCRTTAYHLAEILSDIIGEKVAYKQSGDEIKAEAYQDWVMLVATENKIDHNYESNPSMCNNENYYDKLYIATGNRGNSFPRDRDVIRIATVEEITNFINEFPRVQRVFGKAYEIYKRISEAMPKVSGEKKEGW